MTRREFAQLLASVTAYAALPAVLQGERRRLRLAVSADTIAGANINDARAAYRIWAQEITRSLGIDRTEMIAEVFVPSARMIQMIREGSLDCFALTASEYARVADLIDPDCILVEDYAADGLEYLLTVHNSSSFKRLEDLQGSQITIHHHRDTGLLEPWLSILLANSSLNLPEQFFGNQAFRDDLSQVVLPVFFKRTQAAGLTRRSFDIAVELNPQVGRDIRVLATSPKLVPVIFCFRRGANAEDKRQFKDAVMKIKSVTAGQQILEMFQTQGFVTRQSSCMKGTLELIHQYDRLQSRIEAGRRKTHS